MRPKDLKFLESHEWARLEDKTATIGLSDYAVSQLGDIVFLELPEVGAEIQSGEPFAIVESVKAASDIYSPVSGKIIEVNSELGSYPETVNKDCYGSGWMCKIEITDQSSELMDAQEYEKYIEGI